MKGPKGFGTRGSMDLGTVFDEIFEAAQDFSDEFQRKFTPFGSTGETERGPGACWSFNENTDYYPNYSYPPMNVYMTSDRSLIFEFALAGFDEKDISLSFQGDYMVFSANIPRPDSPDEITQGEISGNRYFKRRLKMKDIEKQKYFVPLDKYAQEKVKAVYKNGILKVTIPPKEEPDQTDGIRIEIIKEGN
ncbi:MAG: Hsp20/alpha crystallin family protein [Treponema sp.]|nr:Hsp20/alpha crystallin family protein [Treponema sp.]